MASVDTKSVCKACPALATTYEGDDVSLLERIVPLVDCIEISPDTIATIDAKRPRLRTEILDEYMAVDGNVEFIAHGIGLSIGSFDHWEEGYLHLLDDLFDRVTLRWHSEHLACTVVAGENIGTMFPVPRTEEALDLVCERVRLIQERYRVPFLLEHVIHLLPDAPAEYTPAGFLNAITSRTGCALVLDAYNLECDIFNRGLNVQEFLDELDLTAVQELHLAGGVQHRGIFLDIHSGRTDERTMDLGQEIIQRTPNLKAVTFEFLKEATRLIGHDGICTELNRIRQVMQ